MQTLADRIRHALVSSTLLHRTPAPASLGTTLHFPTASPASQSTTALLRTVAVRRHAHSQAQARQRARARLDTPSTLTEKAALR